MDGKKFRKIIESGTEDYGSDVWFFLRELAQNSRDADADQIRVSTGYLDENIEFIRFEDNGTGMSRDHANDYLFKLYASSKENQKNSIGKYGIGFWTILKFEPYKIIIESKYKTKAWSIQLNTKLEIENIEPTIKNEGTKITLLRISKFNGPQKYVNTVESELIKYCKYLTHKKTFKSLPILFNNKLINKRMELPGKLSKMINHRNLSGVVALDEEPKVRLYSKGLFVWEGAVLSELTDQSKSNKVRFESGKGLAPVFLLNSSNIDINISRNIPVDNKDLLEMINIAESELSKLILRFIKTTTPWSLFNSINDLFKKILTRIKRSLFLKTMIILFFLIPVEIYLLNTFFQTKITNNKYQISPDEKNIINQVIKKSRSVLSVKDSIYSGASVHSGNILSDTQISYIPLTDGFFKLYPANKYNIRKGFVYSMPFIQKTNNVILKGLQLKEEKISFRIENIEKGRSFLLNKNNYIVDEASLRINKESVDIRVLENFANNTSQIILAENKNLIEYQINALRTPDILTDTEKKKFLEIPEDLVLPQFLSNSLMRTESLSIPDKVNKAELIIRGLLVYDNSNSTVEKYKLEQDKDWLEKVLIIRKGDCDVINGLNTLLLRKMNIPSRLMIGFVGKKGKIIPELHAWTEYYNNGWHIVDVSTTIKTLTESDANILKPTIEFSNKNDFLDNDIETGRYLSIDRKLMIIFAIIFIVLIPMFVFIYIFKNKKKNFDRDKTAMSYNLAEISLNAFLNPEIWKSNPYIWNYGFIPTFGDKFISLSKIILRSKNGSLFKSSSRNILLNKKNVSKLFILNSYDRYYSNLIKSIPGIIDLDVIRDLEIINIDESVINNSKLKKTLKQVELLLDKASNNVLKVFISKKINETAFINIKLNRYIYPYYDQFVIVNPEHSDLKLIIESSANMKYIIFKLIENILNNFDLEDPEVILIKKKVSKSLI